LSYNERAKKYPQNKQITNNEQTKKDVVTNEEELDQLREARGSVHENQVPLVVLKVPTQWGSTENTAEIDFKSLADRNRNNALWALWKSDTLAMRNAVYAIELSFFFFCDPVATIYCIHAC